MYEGLRVFSAYPFCISLQTSNTLTGVLLKQIRFVNFKIFADLFCYSDGDVQSLTVGSVFLLFT
jgi:hypothetical protein